MSGTTTSEQGMNFECSGTGQILRIMKRDNLIKRLNNQASQFDMVVIGGGATGLGIPSTQQREVTA